MMSIKKGTDLSICVETVKQILPLISILTISNHYHIIHQVVYLRHPLKLS